MPAETASEAGRYTSRLTAKLSFLALERAFVAELLPKPLGVCPVGEHHSDERKERAGEDSPERCWNVFDPVDHSDTEFPFDA